MHGPAEVLGVAFGNERVPIYNLSVPGSPTYFVGEHGTWVHNCNISQYVKSGSKIIAKGKDIRKIDRLIELWDGRIRDWKKKKGWNRQGDELHWYEKNGQVFGGKRAGEPDPF